MSKDDRGAPPWWGPAEVEAADDHPDYERAGFIFHEGRDAAWNWNGIDANPYQEGRPGCRFWIAGWRQADQILKGALEARKRDARAIELAPALNWLEASFGAGNQSALAQAVDLCMKNQVPPQGWMAEAVNNLCASPQSGGGKGRHANRQRQYQDQQAHLLRFLAVAGCRYAYDARIQSEIDQDGCDQGEAERRVIEKYGRRPSWDAVKESASILLRGSIAQCTPETAFADYKKVKKEIEINGPESPYIKGVYVNDDVVKFLVGFGVADDERPDWAPPPGAW